jgi:preprotein translocase subunit YajC
VHTTSGMEATVVEIADDTVDLEIAPGVVTRWMKLAVRDRVLPDEDLDEDYDEDEDDDLAESDDVAGAGDSEGPAGSTDESRVTKDS